MLLVDWTHLIGFPDSALFGLKASALRPASPLFCPSCLTGVSVLECLANGCIPLIGYWGIMGEAGTEGGAWLESGCLNSGTEPGGFS